MAQRRQNPFSLGGFGFDDPEQARQLLEQLGLADHFPAANGETDEEEAAPVPGFGERVRRPYAAAGGQEEIVSPQVGDRNTGTQPRTQPTQNPRTQESRADRSANTPAHVLRPDDPFLDAVIESSKTQLESMSAEIFEWKAKVDARDAEIASLKEMNARLQQEKAELEGQITAVRRIVGMGSEREKSPKGDQVRGEEKPTQTMPEKATASMPNTYNPPKPQATASRSDDGFHKVTRRGGHHHRGSRKPNTQSRRPAEHTRPRRARTIFDLPKELIDSIVDYLCPSPNPKQRLEPVRETSKLFDKVWNKDLENWSRTCSRFSRILRSNYWWKVVKFDDEDAMAWHEKAEQISAKNRAFVRAIEFVRSEPERSFEISTERDDYDDYARMFPNLRAIRHHGQIKLIRVLNKSSDWNYDHPLDVVDMLHTSSLVGDNDLKPDSKPAPLDTLILRDGTAVPSDMVYADLTPYRREKPNAVWLTYALRHFVGIENLVLHLRLKDETSAQVAEKEKTPLRILRKEEWPALKTVEFRFAMPYAYGSRDICMLNGFQDLFKRFSPNIEKVSFVVTLENPKTTKGKVAYFRRQHRPAHLTYWGIVKNHYIPTVDRLEKFIVRLAKDLPYLIAFDFRVEDDKVDPAPLVQYRATLERQEGSPPIIKKEYKHRMPKGYPDLPNFWEGHSPEILWALG